MASAANGLGAREFSGPQLAGPAGGQGRARLGIVRGAKWRGPKSNYATLGARGHLCDPGPPVRGRLARARQAIWLPKLVRLAAGARAQMAPLSLGRASACAQTHRRLGARLMDWAANGLAKLDLHPRQMGARGPRRPFWLEFVA